MRPYSALTLVFVSAAACAPVMDPVETFRAKVKPLLQAQCFSCHTDKAMGGLRMDRRESLLKGGSSGAAVVPGKPEQSLLFQAITHNHDRLKMPPQGKLTPVEITEVRAWIEAGVHFDEPAASVNTGKGAAPINSGKHWSFQPVKNTPLPNVQDRSWPKSNIDYFIRSKLEGQGLVPAPPADRPTLLRRVTFDLTGLPPSPEELDAFLADKSPTAFEKVVDRLLASPRYGERWGRFWLDVARYADDDVMGLAAEPFPNAWRYRDWVIQAFNEDMPYNTFVKAQIAGDFMDVEGENRYRPGLGLFGLGPWYYKIVEPPKARADERHDRIDVLTRGFLGLTVACARCHDHKYDPIPTTDYYALAGVFASTEAREYPLAPKDIVDSWEAKQKRILDLESDLKKWTTEESKKLGQRMAPDTEKYLVAAWRVRNGELKIDSALAEYRLDGETLERWVSYLACKDKAHPFLKSFDEARDAPAAVSAAADFQKLLSAVLEEQASIEEHNKKVLEAASKSTDPYDIFCKGCNAVTKTLGRDKYVLWVDLFGAKQQTLEKTPGLFYYSDEKLERFLTEEKKTHFASVKAEIKQRKADLPQRYPFLHTIADVKEPADLPLHRRGDPYNLGEPIPRHFLTILSEGSPSAFRNGSGRIELAERIASNDNPLTARVIVNRVWHHHFGAGLVRSLSNFGLAGERPSHSELLDYLATRFIEMNWSLKRLHREIVLSATYQLSTTAIDANLKVDPENRLLWRANRRRLEVEALRDSILFAAGTLNSTMGGPAEKWNSSRRSIYGEVSRFRTERMLTLFDFPDPTISAEQRSATNTPLQRLFFLNSDIIHANARALAKRIEAEAKDQDSRIEIAHRLLYARPAADKDRQIAIDFLSNGGSWAEYSQILLSANEFQFLD